MRYGVHEFAASQPSMDDRAFAELVADIKANGLKVPIVLFDGAILDGRHRAKACAILGIEPITTTFEGTERAARALVHSMNVERRHLTPAQKREALMAELKRDPTRSDRQIAKATGFAPNTVTAARATLESTAQIAQLPATTGADGKVRPRQTTTVRHANGTTFERALVLPEGKKPRDQRVAEVRALSSEGLNVEQMAARLGLAVSKVRRYASEAGVRFVDDRTHAIKPTRVVEETVNALNGLAQGIGVIRGQPLHIEPIQARALLDDVRVALASVNWLRDQLRRLSA